MYMLYYSGEEITMTKLLEKAITRIKQLPEAEQNVLAGIILEELEDEARWDAAFARSADVLARLAAEAEQQDKTGRSEELDPEKM